MERWGAGCLSTGHLWRCFEDLSSDFLHIFQELQVYIHIPGFPLPTEENLLELSLQTSSNNKPPIETLPTHPLPPHAISLFLKPSQKSEGLISTHPPTIA